MLITKRHFDAASGAFIELKSLKKQAGVWQQRFHEKDVVIQYYEREFPKYRKLDSVNTTLLKNKDREIELINRDLGEYKRAYRIQKVKTLGLSVSLPVAIALSFIAGFYIAK